MFGIDQDYEHDYDYDEKKDRMYAVCMRFNLAKTFRYLWAFPGTILGLLLLCGALLTKGRVRVRDGVLQAHGGVVTWLLRYCTPLPGGVDALTLGHVILGRTDATLAETHNHEMVHVRQYERWGPFFLPAYLLSSLFLFLSGRDFYHDNPFERQAFRS